MIKPSYYSTIISARINTILYCFLAQLTRKHLSESSQSKEQEVKRFIKQASGNYETTAILPPTMEIALKVDSELLEHVHEITDLHISEEICHFMNVLQEELEFRWTCFRRGMYKSICFVSWLCCKPH